MNFISCVIQRFKWKPWWKFKTRPTVNQYNIYKVTGCIQTGSALIWNALIRKRAFASLYKLREMKLIIFSSGIFKIDSEPIFKTFCFIFVFIFTIIHFTFTFYFTFTFIHTYTLFYTYYIFYIIYIHFLYNSY